MQNIVWIRWIPRTFIRKRARLVSEMEGIPLTLINSQVLKASFLKEEVDQIQREVL